MKQDLFDFPSEKRGRSSINFPTSLNISRHGGSVLATLMIVAIAAFDPRLDRWVEERGKGRFFQTFFHSHIFVAGWLAGSANNFFLKNSNY